jgi:uncharacterized protein with WD repeat
VNVPAQTGGNVSRFSDDLWAVKWDTGQQSVHYSSDLYAIGQARDLAEFEGMIMAEAVSVRQVIGPQGGNRTFTISLRNGDWVSSMAAMKTRLEVANIPIEIERIPKKTRTK